MTRDLLTRCGAALYGPRWQSEMARELGVDDRTMRRWIAGDSRVPAGVADDLHRILTERAATIDRLFEEIAERRA